MHFMLISDNHDTLVGMRLAGIEGCIASTPDEVRKVLNEYSADPSTGIILITEVLSKMCESEIDHFKLHTAKPLIVVIPDRHSDGRDSDSVMRYVREAIGIKI